MILNSIRQFSDVLTVQTGNTYTEFLPSPATSDADLIAFVQRLIRMSLGIAALIAVGYLIWNGIQYIMSGGDEGKIDKATKGIIYAVIGLIVCFIAVTFVNFILRNVLQINI